MPWPSNVMQTSMVVPTNTSTIITGSIDLLVIYRPILVYYNYMGSPKVHKRESMCNLSVPQVSRIIDTLW